MRSRRVVAALAAVLAVVLAGVLVLLAGHGGVPVRSGTPTANAAAGSGGLRGGVGAAGNRAGVPSPAAPMLLPAVLAATGQVAGHASGPATGAPGSGPSGAVRPVPAAQPDPAVLAATLRPLLADRALGGRTSAVVLDAATGRRFYDVGGSAAVVPASTAKLATAVAALHVLGAAARLHTRVVRGAAADQVVLVGGGDPTLAGPGLGSVVAAGSALPFPTPARVADLAAATATALHRVAVRSVRLGYDASVFAGPTVASSWKPGYVTSGNVAPVVGLEVDEGRLHAGRPARSTDPARTAALVFATLLTADGITVQGAPAPARVSVPAPTAAAGSRALADVSSPPLSDLVERMLLLSDNDLAEALARQVAVALHLPPTFEGGATAVREALGDLGVGAGVALVDGSGLSRQDRVRTDSLVAILRMAAATDHPELRPVVTGLPVAGFAGTLADRYHKLPARAAAGIVRAKTGTLDHVSSLAGLLVDRDGRLLVFAFVTDGVPGDVPDAAEAALDRTAAALAGCGCR